MRRTYDRTGRDAQLAGTRSAILAAARRVAAEGIETFTITQVAREAHVALRSLYVHFPARAALLREVLMPATTVLPGLDGVALGTTRELLYRLQRSFAALASSLPASERDPAIERQHAVIAAALGPALGALGPRDRQRLLNAVLLISDAHSAEVCTRALGLDPAETGRLVVWCIETLIEGAASGSR